MVTLYGTGGLVVVWLATMFISYRLKLAAALKAEAARMRISDEDTMKQHTWDDDKAYQTHETSEDIERRIREALSQRKNPETPPTGR